MSGDAIGREQLVQALSSFSDDDLKQHGSQLTKNSEDLKQAVVDLQVEQEVLKQEKAQIISTIELMLGELKKLNITSTNLSEPELDESPLQYVGRMWEQVRPRDTAVHVSEHVGEIRKPSESSSSVQQLLDGYGLTPPTVPELGRQLAERGQELADRGEELRQELGKQASSGFSAVYASIDKITTGAKEGPAVSEDEDNTLANDECPEADRTPASASNAMAFGVNASAQQNIQQVAASAQQNLEQVTAHGREWGLKVSNRLSEAFASDRTGDVASASNATPFGLNASTQQNLQQVATQGREWRKQIGNQFSGALGFLTGSADAADASGDDEADRAKPRSSDPRDRDGPSVGALFSYLGTSTRLASELGPDSAGPDVVTPNGPDVEASRVTAPHDANIDGKLREAGKTSGTEIDGGRNGTRQTATEQSGGDVVAGSAAVLGVSSSDTGVKSTLLIEVKLTLGDGSVQVLEVRAADRCKDVATHFVQEHSLKAGFEAPLRAYLMAAEKSAERFPVRLEADLLEIQKDYSSRAPSIE